MPSPPHPRLRNRHSLPPALSNGAHPSDYAARELWTAIPYDSLENLRVVPNFRVADDSARTSFAFQNHLWTKKSFVWSLVISTAMLKKESHEGHAPIGPAGRRTNARMKAKRQFSDDVLAVLQEGKGLRIRAGTSQHRFIGIWAVVVEDRAFIRSWSVNPSGWSQNRRSCRTCKRRAPQGCHRPRLLGKVQHGRCPQVCQGSRKPEIQSHDR